MAASTHVLTLAQENFDREVLQAPETVLVEFRTTWCPPCNRLTPVLESVAAENLGRLKVFVVDVEQDPRFASRFRIESVPTLLIYRGGELIHRLHGELAKPILLEKLGLSRSQAAADSPVTA